MDVIASYSTRPSDSAIIGQSGGDLYYVLYDLVSRNAQVTLEAGTTDKITVTIRDNLSARGAMYLQGEGFYED